METLVANLSAGARRETLAGREYIVAPVSMIVPGILNGSRGPLLYESRDVSLSADSWNGMPIVLRHPTNNGTPVSARSPNVLNEVGLGTVLNTRFDGKLRAEGWFDVANLRRVAPDILNRLQSGKPIELSTGLFADYVPAPSGATHNGQAYSYRVTNLRPDHLAVLPDEIGACSLRDGCGIMVNCRTNEDNDASMIPPTINWAEVSAAGHREDGPVMNRSEDADGPAPVEIDWAAFAALPGR